MSLLSPPLQAFVAVTRRGTVHGAAADLGITQTGVTQRIRALESSLRATLFIRSRRGMRLTGEGEALLRYCQTARELEGETLAKIQGAGTRSEVRLNVVGPTSLMRSRVIPQCLPVIREYPELLLSFRISDADERVEELRDGRAQLAVVRPEQVAREMDSKLLKPKQYVLVGPRAWAKRPVKEVVRGERIIDFDAADRTTHDYLEHHGLAGLARAERHFVNNNESLAEMIEAGLGYGVFTREFAERFLARCAVSVLNGGRGYETRLALAWYPRPESHGYWKALVSAIR